jgi:RNA polymerase sporulation-specific sigma factor
MMYRQEKGSAADLAARTDEQLCDMAATGDRGAEELLVTRYYGLVRVCARPLFLAGGDGEDLIQEGMFGLLRAIREYQADKTASFRTFAEVCIRNRLYSALRAALRDKHHALNESISLDTPFFDSTSYLSGAFTPGNTDPELLVIDRDRVAGLLESTRKQLSEFEAKILGYYLEGLSCHEIAKAVGKSPKSVDNAVQRVRRKAARHISSGEISKR